MTEKNDPYDLVVELANFDPETARPGDVLNWRHDLDRLLRGGREAMDAGIYNVGDPTAIAVREDEILPIHADLQRVVRQYAAGASVTPVAIDSLRVAAVGGETPKLLAIGGTHTVAILTTVMLLVRGERAIRICPECERLFVRVRRQEYCSRLCVNRTNGRDRRAALLEKALTKTMKATRKKRGTR